VVPLTLQSIARACAGELLGGSPDALARRVCTDSRQVTAGDLFVALRGDRFDGHRFLEEVLRKHAAGVIVEREAAAPLPPGLPAIAVDNSRRALGRLAARYRHGFALPLVAVGGSNGKSSTKELIAPVLRQPFAPLWSEASFNNDIGVPLTLLRLERQHQAAVVEVGTNHPGELAPLLAMAEPTHGVITGIGPEHLEFFGDLEGVLREEGTLVEAIPPEGRVFINLSSEPARRLLPRARAPVVTVGWEADKDWSVADFQLDERGATFQVRAPRPEYAGSYRVNLLGRHQILNALLAVAVGAELGVEPRLVRDGLAACLPLKMRLHLWDAGGVKVLDDCYNANVESMAAALQTLQDFPAAGRRIAVLGDMAELGEQSASAHEEVGRRAARAGLDELVMVGKLSKLGAAAARATGCRRVREYVNVAAAGRAVRKLIAPGDVVLLKASRATGFERVAAQLKQGPAAAAPAGPRRSRPN
jgi:UDP-N-acetylmuramoyl-tripeptide--D-alanyl-D-alanine ligase